MFCPCCETRLRSFIPLSNRWKAPVILDAKSWNADDFEGSYSVQNWECPSCKSNPRTRLWLLLFRKSWKDRRGASVFLHVAPEKQLRSFFEGQKDLDYLTLDQSRKDVKLNADLRDLAVLPSKSVDYVLCSHVFEHIPEGDEYALLEFYRVMRSEGWGIVAMPMLRRIKNTVEHTPMMGAVERKRAFGDEDHYRVYSAKDFMEKAKKVGFKTSLQQAGDLGLGESLSKCGISSASSFFLLEKLE